VLDEVSSLLAEDDAAFATAYPGDNSRQQPVHTCDVPADRIDAATPRVWGDTALLQHLRVTRCGPGRPRTTPDAVLGDKAYSARAHRRLLRSRGITAVIPEPCDQIRNRKRRGSAGGRPPVFDAEAYRGRNVVERSCNTVKQWRALATRYDKLAIVYRRAAVLRAITIWLKDL